ncbi:MULTISPECIES: thioredoxin domain-containing protein [Variovorax]|uniref:glutaredoxin n=1 Tax=Variovorax sp. 3P27G3 TaxID=2502214 RepID=UPI001BB13221|nr:glutaredoxin [Variovorax sp. 3P27G3]
MKVEVFYAGGCSNCGASRRELQEAALAALPSGTTWTDIDIDIDIDIVKSIDFAVDLGVLTVAAVAIDGRLVFAKLPAVQQLVSELTARARERCSHGDLARRGRPTPGTTET